MGDFPLIHQSRVIRPDLTTRIAYTILVGMKRITYISNFTKEVGFEDIEQIGETSIRNNKRDGLSGALMCFRGIFYQILEGESEKVDACFERISRDDRHDNIFMLSVENDITDRKYPDWSMKTVVLDEKTSEIIRPVRNLLDALQKTHRILEKFAPSTVLRGIQSGENPLAWDMQYDRKAILFADILGSTTLSETLPIRQVSELLDVYYEIANRAIIENDGTIAKLTGDGLMAYFDYERTDGAASAAIRIQKELAEFRARTNLERGKLLYSGVGISAGKVLRGNIGSMLKRDYTLLGDVVNIAARLEGITRKVGYNIVIDENASRAMASSASLKKIGVYQPRGKLKSLRIFTLDDPAVKFDRSPASIKDGIAGLGESPAA